MSQFLLVTDESNNPVRSATGDPLPLGDPRDYLTQPTVQRFLNLDENNPQKLAAGESLREAGVAFNFETRGFLRPEARAKISKAYSEKKDSLATRLLADPTNYIQAADNSESLARLRNNGFLPVPDDRIPKGVSAEIPLDEKHPKIGAAARLLKGFAKDSQTFADAVQSKFGLEARVVEEGTLKDKIAVRDPNAPLGSKNRAWHVVDPDGFRFDDAFGDAMDLVGDVVAGSIDTIVKGAGAGLVGAGVATLNPALILAGAGAWMAAGGAGELTREVAGNFFGLEDNVSPRRIAFASGGSAVIPIIGGAGAKILGATSKILSKIPKSKGLQTLLSKASAKLGASQELQQAITTRQGIKRVNELRKEVGNRNFLRAISKGFADFKEDVVNTATQAHRQLTKEAIEENAGTVYFKKLSEKGVPIFDDASGNRSVDQFLNETGKKIFPDEKELLVNIHGNVANSIGDGITGLREAQSIQGFLGKILDDGGVSMKGFFTKEEVDILTSGAVDDVQLARVLGQKFSNNPKIVSRITDMARQGKLARGDIPKLLTGGRAIELSPSGLAMVAGLKRNITDDIFESSAKSVNLGDSPGLKRIFRGKSKISKVQLADGGFAATDRSIKSITKKIAQEEGATLEAATQRYFASLTGLERGAQLDQFLGSLNTMNDVLNIKGQQQNIQLAFKKSIERTLQDNVLRKELGQLLGKRQLSIPRVVGLGGVALLTGFDAPIAEIGPVAGIAGFTALNRLLFVDPLASQIRRNRAVLTFLDAPTIFTRKAQQALGQLSQDNAMVGYFNAVTRNLQDKTMELMLDSIQAIDESETQEAVPLQAQQ